jgi:ABC-type molybdate transport system substrate-binding protein
MRLKLICAVLVGLLLVVAPGCGSKKKATTTAPTTTAAKTTPATTTSASGGLNLTSSDCANLAAASTTISQAFTGKASSSLNAQIARLKAIDKVAPAAIKPDFDALLAAAAAYAKAGITPGKTPTAAQLQTLMKGIDVTKLEKAGTDIAAWAKANCTKG